MPAARFAKDRYLRHPNDGKSLLQLDLLPACVLTELDQRRLLVIEGSEVKGEELDSLAGAELSVKGWGGPQMRWANSDLVPPTGTARATADRYP